MQITGCPALCIFWKVMGKDNYASGRNSILKWLDMTNSLNLSENTQIKSSFISFAQNSKPEMFFKNTGG